MDLVDEHYYMAPDWFFANAARYDDYDRKGPKVFAGEYASHDHPTGKANNFPIADLQEAIDYMKDEKLKNHLLEISSALLKLESSDPGEVFGYPDDRKLMSCMTLFEAVSPEQEVFQKVLDKFFDGKRDERTLQLIHQN